jgi:hypothetical protein
MLYTDSLYSQHILQPYRTAVPLTTTLSHAVLTVCINSTFYNLTVKLSRSLLHCLMLYSDSLYSQHILQPYRTSVPLTTTLSHAVQWQFVFTTHSTTITHSCPTHYYTLWCCRSYRQLLKRWQTLASGHDLHSEKIIPEYHAAVLKIAGNLMAKWIVLLSRWHTTNQISCS